MPQVPVLPPTTTGVYTSSQLSAVIAAVAFLLARPLFRGRQTVAQTPTTGVWTAATWDAEDADQYLGAPAAQHDNVTNNTRFQPFYPGWHSVSDAAGWTGNATGRRGLRLAVNGSVLNGSASLIAASAATTIAVPGSTELVYLQLTDFLEVQLFQDTGAGLATVVSTDSRPRVNIRWESS